MYAMYLIAATSKGTSAAVDKMCRIEQRTDKSLKGMRWSPLRYRSSLKSDGQSFNYFHRTTIDRSFSYDGRWDTSGFV